MKIALGLIETKGLIGAIEAADTMAKSANVKIISKEKITAGLVTIKIVGDVASVKSAVDAGAAAAKRVGQLISFHIIPQPDDQLDQFIYETPVAVLPDNQLAIQTKTKKPKIIDVSKISVVEKVNKSIIVDENSLFQDVVLEKKIHMGVNETPKTEFEEPESKIEVLRKQAFDELNNVVENKELIPELEMPSSKELSELNVHKLRHIARSIENFPIKGRQISKATRDELKDYFEKMK